MSKSSLSLLILLIGLNCIKAQFYKDYTTNVYGRQPFKCYTCTNNNDASGSRGKYNDWTNGCGYGNEFNPSNPNVQVENCYTYCLKRETGIVGSKIDVERRCEPTCQEYNGNTRLNFIIDKISCCVGNYCNNQTRLNINLIIYILFIILSLISYYRFI